jgi:hypothetical protein
VQEPFRLKCSLRKLFVFYISGPETQKGVKSNFIFEIYFFCHSLLFNSWPSYTGTVFGVKPSASERASAPKKSNVSSQI